MIYKAMKASMFKAWMKDPDRCPYCESYDLESEEMATPDGGFTSQDMTCGSCCREWTVRFKVDSLTEEVQTCSECGKDLKAGDDVEEDLFCDLAHTACMAAANEDSDEAEDE